MNIHLLDTEVQHYIDTHLHEDVQKIALANPVFEQVSQAELATQLAAKKKAKTKLPTWYHTANIYYPPLLSVEQCSSELTAAYKAGLVSGDILMDVTAGFGVDSAFFARKMKKVISCERDDDLSAISAHNAQQFHLHNMECIAGDGIEFLKSNSLHFDVLYIDPARRSGDQKVFRFKDCSPDVTAVLDLLLKKTDRILIKAAPFLDLRAGLSELHHVREIHIVSTKNECKELLWLIDSQADKEEPMIICSAINKTVKSLSFRLSAISAAPGTLATALHGYLYEPDAALLKSGAFNYIARHFDIQKLHAHSHLYCSEMLKPVFPGRIFKIQAVLPLKELKKEKQLKANVIARNFPEKAESLAKKYRIVPDDNQFILFTQTVNGYVAIKAEIIQHY